MKWKVIRYVEQVIVKLLGMNIIKQQKLKNIHLVRVYVYVYIVFIVTLCMRVVVVVVVDSFSMPLWFLSLAVWSLLPPPAAG